VVIHPAGITGERRPKACECPLSALPPASAQSWPFGRGSVWLGSQWSTHLAHDGVFEGLVAVHPLTLVGVSNPERVALLINAAREEAV
jgi:hypothetical protein